MVNALLLMLRLLHKDNGGQGQQPVYYIPPGGRSQDAFKGLDGGVEVRGCVEGKSLELNDE